MHSFYFAVFKIRDILVRIRIRIRIQVRGSVSLTNRSGSASGSCSFRQWPSSRLQKIIFSIFFAYFFLKVYLHPSSKIKIHKEVTTFLLDDRRIRIRMRYLSLTNGSGSRSRRPKTYGSETLYYYFNVNSQLTVPKRKKKIFQIILEGVLNYILDYRL